MPGELTRWVKARAVPFRSCDPEDGDHADLQPLLDVIGGARIVGLGESTHGTREEARMKHRLFRLLSSHGFTMLALERDMAEMAAFDAVLATHAEIDTLPVAFHPWRSDELLELLRWMQERRLAGDRLRFAGFDMQQEVGPSSLDIVRAHLDARPSTTVTAGDLDLIASNLSDESWGDVDPAAIEAAARLRSAVPPDDEPAAAWAARHALIVEQALAHRAAPQSTPEEEQEAMFQRDAFMAGHIEWLADHLAPGERVVVWAHNFHVGRIDRYMGAKLAERLGDDYVPIGFTFHHGRFRARTYEHEGGPVAPPSAVEATLPDESCIESACHEVGLDQFLVDLHGLPPSESETLMRVVGERVPVERGVRDEFEPVQLGEAFDALVYFEETTPLEVLPWPFD